jgi:hypothetical protein
MNKIIATLIVLLSAGLVQASDICEQNSSLASMRSEYVKTWDVSFEVLEGTEDSNFYCWIGNTDLDTAFEESEEPFESFFVEVSNKCGIVVGADKAQVTLNCMQDMTLPDGEKVVLHRVRSLY